GFLSTLGVASQNADAPDTRAGEHLAAVRGFGQLAGQVEAGKVQALVQAGAPLGTIADVVNHALVGHVGARAALAVVALKLGGGEGAVGQRGEWIVVGGSWRASIA